MKSVGIDLTASGKKRTGVAFLENNYLVLTKRIKSDDDLEKLVQEIKPDIVSIDSPLSLPEDPDKIYRNCDIALRRRGIGVFWTLMPSMKNLTMRGIKLAETLRTRNFSVIESYPGAAQDILGIPRKNRGMELLASGLAEYGIVGNLNVSHDELDAITAAIVGLLYLRGEYEALGCLILPKRREELRKSSV